MNTLKEVRRLSDSFNRDKKSPRSSSNLEHVASNMSSALDPSEMEDRSATISLAIAIISAFMDTISSAYLLSLFCYGRSQLDMLPSKYSLAARSSSA